MSELSLPTDDECGSIGSPGGSLTVLIAAARKGCGSSLGRLLESYRPGLIRLAASRIGAGVRPTITESDLVQDTLVTAALRFDQIQAVSEPAVRAWLHEILRSKLGDGLRRHQAILAQRRRVGGATEGDAVDPGPGPDGRLERRDDLEKLRRVIDAMPADQSQLLTLRFQHNLTFGQIAQRRGCSVSIVWRQWSKAIERLRRQMNQADGPAR